MHILGKPLNCVGGGFKYFLFSPLLGEMIQVDYNFANELKPPTSCLFQKTFSWMNDLFLLVEVELFLLNTLTSSGPNLVLV